MISVIIPTWNCSDLLERALKSLRAQTLAPKEIIVVDDGSLHPGRNMELSYDYDVRYFYQKHANANVARNKGQSLAKGDYYVFVDSDCDYHSTFLEKLYTAIEHNDASFSYCNFKIEGIHPGLHIAGTWSRQRLEAHNFIDTSSLLRADIWQPFDEKLKRLQDWDFWLTVSKNHPPPVYVPEILYINTVRAESVSQTENFEEAKQYIINKHNLNGR